jgi:hypothetical protein
VGLCSLPRSGQPAGLLCCAAAQMFMAMRCNCQQSLDLQIVNRLADEAARCALLHSGAADVTPPEEPAALMVRYHAQWWQYSDNDEADPRSLDVTSVWWLHLHVPGCTSLAGGFRQSGTGSAASAAATATARGAGPCAG